MGVSAVFNWLLQLIEEVQGKIYIEYEITIPGSVNN
jgi:hypothetical protein